MLGIFSMLTNLALTHRHEKATTLTADWTNDDLDELCDIAAACSTPDAVCEPEHLLGVMWVEGHGAFAHAMNPHSSATGLIQWMGQPSAVPGVKLYYGHTRGRFAKLGVKGQLPFVRKWFLPHKGHLTSAARVYTAVFLPAFVRQSVNPNFVLAREDDPNPTLRAAFLWNKYFDNRGNRDGKIQVWELQNAIEKEVAAGGARAEELFTRLYAAKLVHSRQPPGTVA